MLAPQPALWVTKISHKYAAHGAGRKSYQGMQGKNSNLKGFAARLDIDFFVK